MGLLEERVNTVHYQIPIKKLIEAVVTNNRGFDGVNALNIFPEGDYRNLKAWIFEAEESYIYSDWWKRRGYPGFCSMDTYVLNVVAG